MAFAPPRPQSIFGRSAPPQAQIDWRLGAQVGQNIGGGIQSAMSSVAKGIQDLQQAKTKKANEDAIGTLLKKYAPTLGLTDDDIKGAGKNPNLILGLEQLKMQQAEMKRKSDQYEAQQKRLAAQDALAKQNAERQQEEHEMRMDERALELAPDIFQMGPSGTPVMDTEAYANQSESVQAGIRRLSPEAIFNAEKKQQAGKDFLRKAKSGNLNADELTPEELDYAKGVPDKLMNDYLGWNQFTVKTNADDPKIPVGTALIVGGNGQFLGQAKADLSDKLDRFEQDMKQVDSTYELTQSDVRNLYSFNEGRIDLRDLSALMMIHWRDKSARPIIQQLVDQLGSGGGGTPAPTTPGDVPLPKPLPEIPKP